MKLKHILLVVMLLCGIGMASAANDTSMELFTDENTEAAKNTLVDSGAGDLLAFANLAVKIGVWLTPAVLLLTAFVASALGKDDLRKTAITGFIWMVGVLIVYNLFISMIGSLTPDFSSIQI